MPRSEVSFRRGLVVIPELRELLIRERAPFEVIGPRLTPLLEPSAASHVARRRLARVVIVRDGDWYAMTVLPATARLDLSQLRRRTGRYGLAVMEDDTIKGQVLDCPIGAMPPFGRVFGLPVYLDRAFAEEAVIMFESGPDHEEVNMPMGAYVRVERPAIVPLARAA
jgi:Ala-tRNA(Pro) deacylase